MHHQSAAIAPPVDSSTSDLSVSVEPSASVPSVIVPPIDSRASDLSVKPTTIMTQDDSHALKMSPEPSSVAMKLSADNCAVSPVVSFHDLQLIPHRIRPVKKQNRRKPPSYLMTSDEHFDFLESKTKTVPKIKSGRPRARKVSKSDVNKNGRDGIGSSEAKQGLKIKGTSLEENKGWRKLPQITVHKRSKKAKPAADSDAHKSSVDAVDNTPCSYCEIPYSQSDVKWYKCCSCAKWACRKCARMGRGRIFTCHNCK